MKSIILAVISAVILSACLTSPAYPSPKNCDTAADCGFGGTCAAGYCR